MRRVVFQTDLIAAQQSDSRLLMLDTDAAALTTPTSMLRYRAENDEDRFLMLDLWGQ